MKKERPVLEIRRQPGVDTAALTSRWDYGGEGSRVALLQQLKERVEDARADFLVVVGGIVNHRAVLKTVKKLREDQVLAQRKAREELEQLRKELQALVAECKQNKEDKSLQAKAEKKSIEVAQKNEEVKNMKPQTIKELLKEQVEVLAQQIHNDLPKIYEASGKLMKIYIVTSQVYDGDTGREVVRRLLELRRKENNIRYLSSNHPSATTFEIKLKKCTDKTFKVVVPNKSVWRSKYYSTSPDRLLEDEAKRTSQKMASVYAVGCFASSLNRPSGEIPYQRITVPALSKLSDVVTAENMVGIRIVKFIPGEPTCLVKTISFKDFVSREYKFLKAPPKFSKAQVAVFEAIKDEGALTIGMMEDLLGISRNKLEKALKGLMSSRFNKKAGLRYDEGSQTYYFDQAWFRNNVTYEWPKDGWVLDVLAGYGCLHSGSIHTAYRFFLNDLPKMLVDNGVKYFLGVGDLIEGLKHNLSIRGEVYGGMNYTSQEKLSADMNAEVILRALDLNLEAALKNRGDKKLTSEEAAMLMRECMMTFLYWHGNHDEWPRDLGFDPLVTFGHVLRRTLALGVKKVLRKYNLPDISIGELINEKVGERYKGHPYKLPSGIAVDGVHYFAGRTQTSSTWLQRALNQFNAQLIWVANFHVAELVEEWGAEHGLRVATQLPTIKSTSDFEGNKGKKTDFGVGLVKVWSHNGRIMVSETSFLGRNPNESLNNKDIPKLLLKDLGVKWVGDDLLGR